MQAEQLIITLLLNRVAELEHENKYCPLTGVLNKRSLLRQLHKKLLTTVIVIDLVDFSGINKRLGHHQGDLILKKIASYIKSVAGNNSVFRFGGDEFIILLDDNNNPSQIINKLKNCKHPMYLGVASGQATIKQLVKQAFAQVENEKLRN